jgi:hypothetical protein
MLGASNTWESLRSLGWTSYSFAREQTGTHSTSCKFAYHTTTMCIPHSWPFAATPAFDAPSLLASTAHRHFIARPGTAARVTRCRRIFRHDIPVQTHRLPVCSRDAATQYRHHQACATTCASMTCVTGSDFVSASLGLHGMTFFKLTGCQFAPHIPPHFADK